MKSNSIEKSRRMKIPAGIFFNNSGADVMLFFE